MDVDGHADMRSLKKLIMAILLLLVTLFMSGMGLMSWLNLRYSQEAMSALRTRQIEDTFYANLDRIDDQHKLMEKHTGALAQLGEVFYQARRKRGDDRTGMFESAVTERVRDFPEAYGGGIWFEPFAYIPGQRAFALFAKWDKSDAAIDPRYGSEQYNYAGQDWYQAVLPSGRDASTPCPQEVQWTPAYYDPIVEGAVLSVMACLYGDNGAVLGLASTVWRYDEIVRLVRSVDVTPGSFAFLIDGNNRKLSSLLMDGKTDTNQAIMDALSVDDFSSSIAPPEISSSGRFRVPMTTRKVSIVDRDYAFFFSKTRAGMVFGIGVPQDEIDSVLKPMQQSNLRIAIATGVVLLGLSMIILYIVASIMRLLQTLYTDPLTGLENRAKLLHDTHTPGQESLILVNIDSFKEINDFYGYQCADNLLRELAIALRAFIGNESTCVLYKLPADEFALRTSAPLSPQELEARMASLSVFATAQVFRWAGQEFGISITQGAATAARDPSTATGEQLLSSAKIALKFARRQHRNFGVYDPALKVKEEYEQNLLWASLLKAGLQEDRIVPFFQPILNNHSGKVEKFECLVRLMNEQGQAVSPGQFLDVAKKLRLYSEITRIMVDKSFIQLRDKVFDFSLNLSYEDLSDPTTISFIKTRLQETGMGPRVIFEILESEGIKNYDEVKTFIDEVKAFGARVAIDDFGAGYSNFEHLLRLGADIIKIDGSLIRNLDSDPSAWTITRGIVHFAQELHMQTVAEFVHSPLIQEKVKQLGIDYTQGAWLGMPAAQLCDHVPEDPTGLIAIAPVT